MGLNDVARVIEQNIVNDPNGWGEDIIFTPRSTNIPITGLRAMVQDMRQDMLNEKSKVYEDKRAFLSVFLNIRPKRGDMITYDGIVYVVDNMEGVNPYDIFCHANARPTAGRSGRTES